MLVFCLAKPAVENLPKVAENIELTATKRPRDDSLELSSAEENLPKKPKENPSSTPPPEKIPVHEQQGVDIESLLPPSTVVKTLCVNVEKLQEKPKDKSEVVEVVINKEKTIEKQQVSPSKDVESKKTFEEKKKEGSQSSPSPVSAVVEPPPESPPKKSTKRTRGKRKSGELPPIDPEAIIEKKNLRSSASRSAAAAAARAAAEQAAAARQQAEAEQAAQKLQDSSESA